MAVLAAAAPCAPAAEARYTVRRGDNLTVIARHFGTSVDALRRANGLQGDLLGVGQILRIAAPFTATAAREPRWERPARRLGEVLRPFGPYQKGSVRMDRRGVDLACAPGEVVSAPATGVVRFLGPLEGYGHLAILDHGGGWATVLSPLDPAHLAVQEGTAVLAGDRLGLVGEPVEEGPPYLHVELRRDERAIAPDRLLK
ncbi:MAG: LysM peptidoglycan-binding domain-containing M23 family metallopeptidase [Krumholzibacteria bacterium]|nr:LysM peptidoglycan-binding domain-containing M23 family metallopeptidase [Candidatus Krumholzibacteria bacterium]